MSAPDFNSSRPAIPSDLPDILAIEKLSFPDPWTLEEFQATCFGKGTCRTLVARVKQKVAGFLIYETLSEEAQILNLAVHPKQRRKGIGSFLLASMQDTLKVAEVKRTTLNIRESNVSGQLFFKANGYTATDTLKELYQGTEEDAYHMIFSAPSI